MRNPEILISPDHFFNWKKQIETQEVYEALKEVIKEFDERLQNPDVIIESDGINALYRLLGMRDGLRMVLSMEFDDIKKILEYPEEIKNEN